MSGLSFNNPKVQRLRRLIGRRSSRRAERRFVVEGPVLVDEAVRAGWICEEQFVPADGSGAIAGAGEVRELAPGVFERLGSTDSPRPPIAVAEMPSTDVAGTLARARWLLVLQRIRDPGNLGTVIRSAEASGADAVVVTPESVDPFAPKVVRASAGALFHVPVIEATLGEVAAAGLQLVGTTSHDHDDTIESHVDADLTGRVAIVLGNESSGLALDEPGVTIDRWITIAHHGRSESLNVAMAAAVLAFEVARQRNGAIPPSPG
jgi:TrmH family RNA methyltransferase